MWYRISPMWQKKSRKKFVIWVAWVLGLTGEQQAAPPQMQTWGLKTPGSLKQKLQDNRSRSKKGGSGPEYWDSVIEVIENHYGHKA